jgi:ubiquinone/menaquinone biosynthesis C-methylase UbiE
MQQIKESMRAVWMAGDFGVAAKTVAGGAEQFVNGIDIPSGAQVLDVACGTGNSAIPLARRGATVTGVDIATNLLAQARERAAAEGVTLRFDEGDAEELPYPDGTFDAVVTMFGAMFAPRPELVAAEFARVLKPGGLLAMANWNPTSFAGKMFQVTGRHAPPPAGLAPPSLWGDDKTVRARLEQDFENIATEIVPIVFDMPTSPAGAVTFFRTYFGPTQMAFNRLDAAGQQAFAAELESLFASANTATDGPNHTVVPNEFLKLTARRK